MLAVIKTGGKQYAVKEGTTLNVELLKTDDETFRFTDVLFISDGNDYKIGTPVLEGASVEAEILGDVKADKVFVFKKRRRNDYRKRFGHRQEYTRVKITKINA